ncbi:MAG: putative quinol monooxygenase [Antarcticimicrobium sp.]|uniref:putative quinol monooxygenase n=1 Tax=Antarcticimicrobium sp. TaxID=2824147 RepID=UPI00262B1D4F|nr:putative quinol monooxygenase [Antarcticimicrobium sp.]MDF1717856.1 putative quinol monooxygenase [Antarcticimicrobium sp.]
MLIITGTFEVAPDRIEAAQSAMTKMMQATRAEAGCLTYDFSQALGAPQRFRVYEEWEEAAALDAHRQSAHMTTYRAAMAENGVRDRALFLIQAGLKVPLG